MNVKEKWGGAGWKEEKKEKREENEKGGERKEREEATQGEGSGGSPFLKGCNYSVSTPPPPSRSGQEKKKPCGRARLCVLFSCDDVDAYRTFAGVSSQVLVKPHRQSCDGPDG